MNNNVPLEDLTRETSLFDIFKQCHIYFVNKVNLLLTFCVFAVMVSYVFIGDVNHSSYVLKVRGLADLGLSFVASILGFLITGFTIFASLSDREFLRLMATRKHNDHDISYLKYTYFAFMYVFIVYLLFGTFCLLVKLFTDKQYIAMHVVKGIHTTLHTDRRIISGLFHAFLGTWFFYLFAILKGFIFNVYHVLVTRIRWECAIKSGNTDEG
ncbi:hypothetical protein KP003_06900 [Geomonas nitrogeniifigens]|uniref:hypothetical protein n=1 Tax=Geomonas diazotrophica TaxID=2843197 RepID=UPI001C2C6EA3|nr:hypothetical protein [Geomonas nitrogeniifigens]QXE88120.1 hypothetical protein KP003_06900 [Geomonas nitrogeniifigens]